MVLFLVSRWLARLLAGLVACFRCLLQLLASTACYNCLLQLLATTACFNCLLQLLVLALYNMDVCCMPGEDVKLNDQESDCCLVLKLYGV